jgi:hypothetical protein
MMHLALEMHLQDLLGTNAANMSSDGIASILRPGSWRFAFKYELLTTTIPHCVPPAILPAAYSLTPAYK